VSAQNVINIFWCKITPSGTVTQADLDTWTAAFLAAFKADLMPQMSSQYALSGCQATYFVDGTPGNVLQSTASLTGSGGIGGTLDAGLAAVVSWLSTAYWRGGKPRTYLVAPAGSLSATARSSWTSTYITNLTAAAATFRGAVNGLTGGATIASTVHGFVSFFHGAAARVPPLFFASTGQKVHPRIGHQRRRDGKWLT
jgi:hypothetical protein